MKLREASLSEIVLFENLQWQILNIRNNPSSFSLLLHGLLFAYFYSLLMGGWEETRSLGLLLVGGTAEGSPLRIF